MARFISIIVGLGFIAALFWGFITTPREAAVESAAAYVHEHREEKKVPFSFQGPLGKYDRQ